MASKKMQPEKKEVWFQAQKYGYGWGAPITWQGWLVLLGYIVLIILGCLAWPHPWNMIWFILYILVLSILLILICLKKGEKLKWRWGDK